MMEENQSADSNESNTFTSFEEILALMDFGNHPNFQDMEPASEPNVAQMADNMLTRLWPLEQQSFSSVAHPETMVVHPQSTFTGPYNFLVRFPKQDDNRGPKTSAWVYSDNLDELFVRMNMDCPVEVCLNHPVPPSAVIRITPVYRRAMDQNQVPTRCFVHSESRDETNRDHPAVQHLIRSYMLGAEHVTDPETGRMSLLLPCQGTHHFSSLKYVLRFMCRTSCVGGMNRRPFNVEFTLEINGKSMGKQVKKVHVCAAPRRDCKNEEKRYICKRTASAMLPPFEENKPKDTDLPLAQDVKRVCKRYTSALNENLQQDTKHRKVYKLTVKSPKVYKILRGLQQIVERHMRKQDPRNSTEDEI